MFSKVAEASVCGKGYIKSLFYFINIVKNKINTYFIYQVSLFSPEGDVILMEPSKADVIIIANDNPYGVLSLRSVDLISLPRAQINEDLDSDVIFTIVRNAGDFGDISVVWVVARNDSKSASVTEDLNPASGTVTFAQGEREKPIIINIVDDSLSEPSERFVVRLLPNVTGNAKVDGITDGILVIEDSDNLYGVVEFAAAGRQQLIIVSYLIQLFFL